MAYKIVTALKGADGDVRLWSIEEFYDGLQSQPMIRGDYPATAATNETRRISYSAPWSTDPIPVHTYMNESVMQYLVNENALTVHPSFIINHAGEPLENKTLTLKNGVKIKTHATGDELTVEDADGVTVLSYNSVTINYRYYTNGLYLYMDDEAQEAFFGTLWFNPVFDQNADRQEGGFYLKGLTNSQTNRQNLWKALQGMKVPPDPYAKGSYSEPSAPEATGTFDDASDAVDVPSVPALNLSINGFITAYAPTLTQINDLANFIWTDWLAGTPVLPKIFADPADAIVSLHMLPFEPDTSTAVEVTVGNYSSGISMDPMTNQFYTINAGSLEIEEYWGNYLDYNPYTKLTLFLPYVGEITLNPDEVMGHELTIKYRADAMTGAFVAFLIREDSKILGEYAGNCSLQVPISSANYSQLHSALLGLATSAVGATAGAAGSGIAGLLSGGSGAITSAAGMMDSKVRHGRSGALGSAAGFMGSQTPYLIIERARQCLPFDLNKFAGYPSQITARLGDLYGFTSVSQIVLDGIPLTDEELGELRQILEGGVYL